MNIENLKQPIWLIHQKFKDKTRITDLRYLQVVTKLSVQEKSLIDCYICDGSKNVFRISGVEDLGNFNKPWKFEFFNPMRKIKLALEEVLDEEVNRKVFQLISEKNDNEW